MSTRAILLDAFDGAVQVLVVEEKARGQLSLPELNVHRLSDIWFWSALCGTISATTVFPGCKWPQW